MSGALTGVGGGLAPSGLNRSCGRSLLPDDVVDHEDLVQRRPHQLDELLVRGMGQLASAAFGVIERDEEAVRETGRLLLHADVGAPFKIYDRWNHRR